MTTSASATSRRNSSRPSWVGEVERAAVLVAVDGVEVRRLVPDAFDVGALAGQGAKDVPVVDALDLDDLGAHVGEESRAVGARPGHRQVEDADAVQGETVHYR